MTPAPSPSALRELRGFALLGAVVMTVVGALIYVVFTSAWAPWIIGTAAVALIVVIASVPVAIVTVGVAMVHPDSRAALLELHEREKGRRHLERVTAASLPPHEQHLHLGSGVELPHGGYSRRD